MNQTDQVIDKSKWNYTVIENEIIETELLDIYEKILYVTLKRFANIQTGEAFPGVKRVSILAGMSERKARSVIGSLSEKGFVKVEHRKNQTSIYTLLSVPAHNSVGRARGAGGGARGAGGVMHVVQEGHAHGADELKKHELKRTELKKENYILSDSMNQTTSEIPYVEIIDYLNRSCNTKFRASTQKTKSLIKARWNEGFRFEHFKKVIHQKKTQWLNDPNMSKYLRPETLFGTKFEGYLNERGKQNENDRQRHSKNEFTDGINF